jgi:hypothetical protein
VNKEEINDLIDDWHHSALDVPIYTWLGMTWEEYAKWVRTGDDPRDAQPS